MAALECQWHLLIIMLAKLSVHLKTIILFIALSILLFGFTFDLSNEKPYILNYTPSSSDGRSTYQAEGLSKDSASASGLVLPNEKTTAVVEETFPIHSDIRNPVRLSKMAMPLCSKRHQPISKPS